jgi:hypothetical protein
MTLSQFHKLDMQVVKFNLRREFNDNPNEFRKKITYQQVMVYVMVGGGFVGRSHAEQPAGAYVDGRCSKPPYALRAISQATEVLAIMAEVAGLDPNHLPEMYNIHCSGVF